ncbi:hypothetical protein FRB94_001418 [Tulasnella sp. JGI-2019a]|nr:hypothetical protein FRB94_001418 [Tulasnella sp. JGI-2019a]KAG9006296.1 hypothetical protein FRB93_008785 [Tulasnella sp. JGI-2019a]
MTTNGRPSSPSLTFPYDVLTCIVEKCSRYTLLELCLVNQAFYSVAVARLYRDPFGLIADELSDSFTRLKLYRLFSTNTHLASYVKRFISSKRSHLSDRISDEWMVPPSLRNLTTVEWRDGASIIAVSLFTNRCPSRDITSVWLAPGIIGQLPPSFWPWVESQMNIREIGLHWNCDPSTIPPTLTFPKLESVGATPRVAKILVPNRSIRAFDGIGSIGNATSPIWSLEDLKYILPHLGIGLKSIGGIKVSRRNVTSFLRLVRKWCPFVETIHFLIDSKELGILYAPGVINSEDLVSALRGFKCLRNLYLTVDYKSTPDSVREMIKEIANDCPTLSFVKWTSTVMPGDRIYTNYAFAEFRYELVEGLWSRVELPLDDGYPIAYRGPASW